MTRTALHPNHLLGSAPAEHERLKRQAGMLAPSTERLFRDAGVTTGQHVLDLGSGVGDVALLLARIVGPAGRVVGADRDASALAEARRRAREAGATHVQLMQAELTNLEMPAEFDAVVGRFVLMFMPEPAKTLAQLVRYLRPGGVIAFQEASWSSFLNQSRDLPLHTACGELICEALLRTGAMPSMELVLFRGLRAAGIVDLQLRVEVPIANRAEERHWLHDLMQTVLPQCAALGIGTGPVGSADTLQQRLGSELLVRDAYSPLVGLVGAFGRLAH